MSIDALYQTDDLYLASALVNAGVKLMGTVQHGDRGVFQFEQCSTLHGVISRWYERDLVQNVRDYVKAWVDLKRRVSQIDSGLQNQRTVDHAGVQVFRKRI